MGGRRSRRAGASIAGCLRVSEAYQNMVICLAPLAVISRGGMVAASQPLAVAAGLRDLAQGGNAADAAVATAAALNVTEPTSTGLGGDCFALFYDAATRQVSALNGSGALPAALTPGAPAARRLLRRAAPLPPLHRHRARRLRRLVRPGRALRPPADAALSWRPPSAWRRRASRWRRSPPISGSAARGAPAAASAVGGQELTIDGRGPRAGRDLPQPRPGAHAARSCRRRQGCLLPGRDRRGDCRASCSRRAAA